MIKNRVKNIKKSQKICVCFCFINVPKTTLLLSLFADESNQAKTRFTRQSKGAATHFDFSSQLLYCFFSGFERPHSFPFLFFFVERGLCFFFIRFKSMVFGVLWFSKCDQPLLTCHYLQHLSSTAKLDIIYLCIVYVYKILCPLMQTSLTCSKCFAYNYIRPRLTRGLRP